MGVVGEEGHSSGNLSTTLETEKAAQTQVSDLRCRIIYLCDDAKKEAGYIPR